MADDIKSIMQDTRPIYALYDRASELLWRINYQYVSKIVPYQEPGEMGYVTWFAVYYGDNIRVRIPARMCQVEYVAE